MPASKTTVPSPSLPAGDFKALFRGHPSGVTVITADAGEGPVALTASSVASVSAQPPLLVFSVSALSSASEVLARAETVVVHFLDAQDIEVAKLGATSGIDRFTQAQTWTRLESGETVYDGVRAWVRCEITKRVPAGEFTVFIAHALESHVARDVASGEAGNALVYHNKIWHQLDNHAGIDTESSSFREVNSHTAT